MGVALFVILGWNLIKVGLDVRASGEVSSTLQIKFYPVVLGLAVASFLQCVVMFCDILRVARGDHE